MLISRRHLLKASLATLAMQAFPVKALNSPLTIWGPPVAPTVLLAIAAEMGEARKIRPFNVRSWQNPDQLRAGLLNKSIELSIVPNYVAANLRAQGQPVILYNIMTKGLLSIMSKNQAITDLKQLSGQKLVMPFKNDMPDLVLQILAKHQGIDLTPFITYTATPPEAVTLFLQKDYPNALLPEPIASASILRGKQIGSHIVRSIELADLWSSTFNTKNGLLMAGLMVTEQIYQQEPHFLAQLNQDLQNAVNWVQNNPRSAAEIAASYMPAPVPAIEQAFPYSGLTALRTTEIQDELLAFQFALYELNPKIVGEKRPNSNLFG